MNIRFILDYISANSDNAVRSRAMKLPVELQSFSEGKFEFTHNGSELEPYEISIAFDTERIHKITCTCPYDQGGLCKHAVAALYYLIREKDNKVLFSKGLMESNKTAPVSNKGKYILKDDVLNPAEIAPGFRYSGYHYSTSEITDVTLEKITTEYRGWEGYYQTFEYDRPTRTLSTACSCSKKPEWCDHRQKGLEKIIDTYGDDIFTTYYLEDKIAAYLAQYGMTPEDDYQSVFQYELTPKGLIFSSKYKNIQPLHIKRKSFYPDEETEALLRLPYYGNNEDRQTGVGVCLLMNKSSYSGIFPVTGKYNKAKTDFASSFVALTETYLEKFLDKISDDKDLNFVMKMLKLREFFRYNNKRDIQRLAKAITIMNDLLPELKERFIYALNPKDNLVRKNLRPLTIEDEPISLSYVVTGNDMFYTMKVKVSIGENTYSVNSSKIIIGDFFVAIEDKLYPIKDADLSYRLNYHQEASEFNYFKKDFENYYNNVLQPLNQRYEVQLSFAKKERKSKSSVVLEKHVYLKDLEGQYILFQPMVQYGEKQIPVTSKEQLIVYSQDGMVAYHERDQAFEDDFLQEFKSLHPDFEEQRQHYYLLPEQLLENYWILHAVERMKQLGIKVFGVNELKSFKFNIHKPMISIKVNSEIDWLDIVIDISFGKQKVDIRELRKSFIKKSNYVLLGDGTLGVLPEDWMKKFEGYFRTGQVKKDSIQISSYQFGIIDELYHELEQKPVFLTELYEKKIRLQHISEIENVPVPKGIKAQLRDYQQHGLNWLAFLDKHRLGGCLADDMGLGKTLQAITFLQYLKTTQKPKEPSLIIAPTSLIFNWNKEVEKFCPTLKMLTYTGGDRSVKKDDFQKYDVVLSTYGTLLNDIDFLKDENFHYVILDESQAIKNPDSKRYKAVRLLKAYNRLVLTGTPIENNTFDLYAQLNFLNPGLLGSISHFKTTFSDSIDKDKDVDTSQLLSKIITPFVLRRTKEDVAKELPDKTESVIYCEMSSDQRKVYDFFKDKYRDYLLNKIDENGVARSQMYILEGLTKLRQICNSTALINEEEDFGQFSVKLETLVEHIKEKTGQHKILVFSQFVKMLQIIKSRLDEEHISYEYLDGQTRDRQSSVDNFQQKKDVRVFLISLKAGGTGLNLTEADYVYIVDPWWNPAVENQAIDRCYRIGQDKKVMAYRMICKDTIEEKIVMLQTKKKAVAASIISVDDEKKSFDLDEVKDLFR